MRSSISSSVVVLDYTSDTNVILSRNNAQVSLVSLPFVMTHTGKRETLYITQWVRVDAYTQAITHFTQRKKMLTEIHVNINTTRETQVHSKIEH